ncbi:Rho GTPase [Ascosphaera pollenicola]|nr:Rho GTPase [Ascosphaera pollenicola]
MLADMLARLSNTIAEQKTDFLTFSMEILTTLKIIIGSLRQPDLLRYPQLFWAACACLETIHEHEYMEGIGILEKYVANVDLTDPMVLGKLLEAKPARWEGNFEGIQSLCYVGLKSCEAFERVIRLIHALTPLPNHGLIGDSNRLLFALLANLPGFLYQFDLAEKQGEVYEHATCLAHVAENNGCPELAGCLSRFASEHYNSSQDFLNEIMKAIRLYFFASQEVQSLIFLMGLLTNATSWFRVKIMDILSIILSSVDMSRADIACYGFDALGPLFRLLRTDLCSRALEVMDHIMTVSGNPLDKHYLRMSMTSSSASRAARKEFDTIDSLYGIPEPTGWSIPCPTVQASLTRHNVFAVFCTCADEVEEGVGIQPAAPSPDVELHVEEFNEPYYPMIREDARDPMQPQNEPELKELLQRLDSLDDFFEEAASDVVNPDALTDATIHALSSFKDANANLYDQQTAPLLRKSLGRRPSTSSFHNGLNEYNNRRSSTSRAEFSFHNAKSSDEAPRSQQQQQQRTSLHQRSITVPAASSNYYHGGVIAPDGLMMDASSSDTQLASHVDAPMHQRRRPSHTQQLTTAFELVSDSDGDDAILYDSDDQCLEHPASPRSAHSHVPNSTGNLPPFAPRPIDGPFSFESAMRSGARRFTGTSTKERPVMVTRSGQQAPLQQPQRANTGVGDSPRVPKVPMDFLDGVRSVPASPQR